MFYLLIPELHNNLLFTNGPKLIVFNWVNCLSNDYFNSVKTGC